MQEITIICKICNKKLYTYSQVSFRHYKSPVKKCPKCGTAYSDYRCHELAIEGIPEDAFRIKKLIALMVIGFLVTYRGYYLMGMHQLNIPENSQWFLPVSFMLLGGCTILGAVIDMIWIISGAKRKHYECLLMESEKRLKDAEYVSILQKLGYTIPEKYL